MDDRGVSGLEQASREELLAQVVAQSGLIEQLQQQVAAQAARIAELERRLPRNSGNSSKAPPTDNVLPGRAHSRMVFLDNVDADYFEDFADSAGWVESGLDPDSYDEENFPSRLWETSDGTVRFVDDTVLRLQFVDIVPPSAAVEEAIRGAFEARYRDELVDLVDLSAPTEQVRRALRRLGSGAWRTPFSEPIFEVVMRALDSEDAEVVDAGLDVVHRTHWSRFRPRLNELAENPPDGVARWALNDALALVPDATASEVRDWIGEYDL